MKHTNSRLIRWALKLQAYNFEVIHRTGKRNQHCDALSRRDYPTQKQSYIDQSTQTKVDILNPIDSDPAQQSNVQSNQLDTKQENQYTEVTFIYPGESPELIKNQLKSVDIFTLDNIFNLQKQCPYFGPIIIFLQDGSLPQDKKRVHAIPYESNQKFEHQNMNLSNK